MSYETNPPCSFCQREGGYRILPGGEIYPPAESVAPFTGRQYLTNDDKPPKRIGECWDYEPACGVHAHEIIEAERTASRPDATPGRRAPGGRGLRLVGATAEAPARE